MKISVYIKALFITGISGLILFAGFYQWRKSTNTEYDRPSLSMLEKMETEGVPDFTLPTIEGSPFELRSLNGQVVIINFWASWCGPCLEEFPSMIELITKLEGKVKLVAIAQDTKKEEVTSFLKAFPKSHHPSIIVVWDESHDVAKKYGVDRLPESFVVGKDFKLSRKISGSINWSTPDAIEFMNALVNK